jgi:hypothetical protein
MSGSPPPEFFHSQLLLAIAIFVVTTIIDLKIAFPAFYAAIGLRIPNAAGHHESGLTIPP